MFSKFFTQLFHRPRPHGQFMGRARTCDANNYGPNTALKYRMGAGFPGDVNRTRPAVIEPVQLDATLPAFFGAAGIYTNTNTFRGMQAGDAALTKIDGFLVRPYPVSQLTAATAMAPAALGGGGPQVGPADILKSGYIMATVNGAVVKGGTVYVWVAASAGNHVQGGLEAAATGGSTIQLDARTYFNGPADANNVVEVAFNI